MSEMVESTITSHTYVAHVPVPSQKEVNLHTLGVTVATLLQNKIDRKQVKQKNFASVKLFSIHFLQLSQQNSLLQFSWFSVISFHSFCDCLSCTSRMPIQDILNTL